MAYFGKVILKVTSNNTHTPKPYVTWRIFCLATICLIFSRTWLQSMPASEVNRFQP